MVFAVASPMDTRVANVPQVHTLVYSQTKDSFLMLSRTGPVVSEVYCSSETPVGYALYFLPLLP
jgi:hypothetical protein